MRPRPPSTHAAPTAPRSPSPECWRSRPCRQARLYLHVYDSSLAPGTFEARATHHGAVYGAGRGRQDRGVENDSTQGATVATGGRSADEPARAGTPVPQGSNAALPTTGSRQASDRPISRTRIRATARVQVPPRVQGLHRVAVRDDKGKPGTSQVEVSYRRMTVRLPIGKQKR